jgi:cytochrome b561
MSWINTEHRYGRWTKVFHWLIVGLFAWQYVAGFVMQRMAEGERVWGLSQDTLFNWHKSLGLVALAIAILRILNRRAGSLPNWAPTLTDGEKRFIHRAEQVLYAAMVVMPVSGFLFVMAGDYGVMLFGRWPLPNPIGKLGWLAALAQGIHIGAAWCLAAAMLGHIGLVVWHQLVMRDGLLWRMLPAGLGPKTPPR